MNLNKILFIIILLALAIGAYTAFFGTSMVPSEETDETTLLDAENVLENIEDDALALEVKAQLLAAPEVGAFGIDVKQQNKTDVILSGYVTSAQEKAYAKLVAQSVEGVNVVENLIEVKENKGVDDSYNPLPTSSNNGS